VYIQAQIEDFLSALDAALPGVSAQASRASDGGAIFARGHWLPQRYSKGSYTCYLPGQFTSICGVEGESQNGLKFAGEHADSFYDWQGFMEGAANSGIAAADEILDDIRAWRL
jgi:monoamine oxidase